MIYSILGGRLMTLLSPEPLGRPGGDTVAWIRQLRADLPKNQPKTEALAAKKPHPATATRHLRLSAGIAVDSDDNAIN
jgi:hypothetical protein